MAGSLLQNTIIYIYFREENRLKADNHSEFMKRKPRILNVIRIFFGYALN